ncbi:SHOCT domain-containing protein [Deltaproteobacteria bacterium]|nr:SHOCT domain-containing protein [Deltaproteobacteria bacterium]
MSQDSFVTEYLFLPIIFFLVIILIYSYIKKKLLRDDREDLESLKLLQELHDSGTINENEFEKKKNRITSKW